MPKICLKSPARTLFLALIMVSASSFAGYSDDPDCKAVSDSAKNAANQASQQIDTVAQQIDAAILNSKSCVDQLLAQANRAVPDFGGGLVTSIANSFRDALIQKGCQIIGNAQNQVQGQVSTAIGSAGLPSIASLPGVSTPPIAPVTSTAAESSLWDRISSSLFK